MYFDIENLQLSINIKLKKNNQFQSKTCTCQYSLICEFRRRSYRDVLETWGPGVPYYSSSLTPIKVVTIEYSRARSMQASRDFDIVGLHRVARARDSLNIVSSFSFLPFTIVKKIAGDVCGKYSPCINEILLLRTFMI